MKFFLDTACPKELEGILALHPVDGLTTNPTLLARHNEDPIQIIKNLSEMIDGPISVQATTTNAKEMIAQGEKLYALKPSQIVIKLPMTWEGLEACRTLRAQHIPVNMTLCFTLAQAVLAAKAGATYVSPFFGRLEDFIDNKEEAFSLLWKMRNVFDRSRLTTHILAASIRTLAQAEQAISWHADCMTLPPALFKQLIEHTLTQDGLERFVKDWEKIKRPLTPF